MAIRLRWPRWLRSSPDRIAARKLPVPHRPVDSVPRKSQAHRSRRIVMATLAGAVILVIGCLIGSRFMSTPAQLAASALPPAPSVITASVENRVVSNQIVTRGLVTSPNSVDLLREHGITPGPANVVTAVPLSSGAVVTAGMVVVEISGRPQFVLKGAFPSYRDLVEGLVGPDVAQLRQALAEIGFSTDSDPAGTFGSETATAVSSLYSSAGYGGQRVLPTNEVTFVPTLPTTLELANVRVGALSSTSSILLESGDLEVTVKADAQIMALSKVGLPVSVVSDTDGDTISGTVAGTAETLVATGPTSTESTETGSPPADAVKERILRVLPNAPLPSSWRGQDVRVTIADGSSDGEVLAVPVSAIFTSATGATIVTIVSQDEGTTTRRQIDVKPGVIGQGFVEVTPIGAGSVLVAGDQVIVGSQ
jgi:hypothetical protein